MNESQNSDPEKKPKGNPREAFLEQDSQLSKDIHQYRLHSQETHKNAGKYIKSIVYGGLDGILTTFAVVSSVAGAHLANSVVVIVGIANLFADGIAMGIGDFLSSSAETYFAQMERKREAWECENYLDGEKQEMVDLYVKKGIEQQDAEKLVDIMSKHKDAFVDIMLIEELGIMPPDPDDAPWKDGIITFFSFCIFGFIPLLAYVATINQKNESSAGLAFIIACVLTGITLFFLGALTSRVTAESWWKSGLKSLVMGAFGSSVAYLIGYLLSL
jgi:VIT1/CCC1 family predicted Fe2+/Mn2+ transporter